MTNEMTYRILYLAFMGCAAPAACTEVLAAVELSRKESSITNEQANELVTMICEHAIRLCKKESAK